MKWIALLLLCLIAGAAHAANPLTQGVKTWSATQALTAAAPTTGASVGIDLKTVVAWRLIVCAPSAQALTGGGVKVWIRAADGLWADTPKLEAQLTFASTSQRCQSFGEFNVSVRTGWLYVTLNAATLSGAGTEASLRLEYQIL